MNLRWSWDERTRDLFRWVDPEAWDANQHDPVRLLATVPPERLQALAADQAFLGYLDEIDDELTRYLSEPRWFQSARADSPLRPGRLLLPRVRHLRGPAAVLRRPRRAGRRPPQGGLRPGRPARRRRAVLRPRLLPPEPQPRRLAAGALPRARPVHDGHPAVRRRPGHRRAGRRDAASARSGGPTSAGRRCTCSTPTSRTTPPHLRQVTDRLYGGDTEHRLQQEIVLGIGGVRALQAARPRRPGVPHQRGPRRLPRPRAHPPAGAAGPSRSPRRSRRRGPANIFTTHTPVPAGIDRFPRELMERYFDGFAARAAASPSRT